MTNGEARPMPPCSRAVEDRCADDPTKKSEMNIKEDSVDWLIKKGKSLNLRAFLC